MTNRERIKQSRLSVSPAEMEVVEDLFWAFHFRKEEGPTIDAVSPTCHTTAKFVCRATAVVPLDVLVLV